MTDPTFSELLSDHLDGTLNANDQQLLAAMLRDPACAKKFVEFCLIDAMLAWEHGAMPALEPPTPMRPRRSRRLVWWCVPAVAASLLLVFALILSDRPPARGPADGKENPPSAMRDSEKSVRIASRLQQGQELLVGDFELDTGFVQTYLDGVEMVIEAPCRMRVISNEVIQIDSGRLTARVPKRKPEFRIGFSGSAMSQLHAGTVAGIEADAETCEIHVFEGEVDVMPRAKQQSFRLTRFMATRVGRTGLPVGVDVDSDRFVQTFQEPTQGFTQLVLSFDPVVYLRMGLMADGRTLANDAPGKVNDVGRVYPGRMGRPPFGPGQIGAALRLQGPEREAYAVLTKCPVAAKELTVCAWVRAQSRPRWASIVKQGTSPLGQFHFGLHGDEGDLEVQIRSESGTVAAIREKSPLPLDRWQFVAFSFDGTRLMLYRGDHAIGSIPCTGLSSDGTSDLGIGVKLGINNQPAADNPGFWDGRIDELAIFHRALSAGDLQKLYRTGLSLRKSSKSE